ncbi:molybdopterin-guanine dinucleotide biosynthesis protein B [Cohnella yongneupensis]|uniref:Molybdopterin-guanine dinucleotide biosynthesis protein B n=1 Tax=Cohnella yongneupensis TaxID=425006 RepID=A0ABW0QZF9_9BACL
MIVLQIVGYKNAGKTTLASAIIERLSSLGYLIGSVKHDAHNFVPDVPGTDSSRHREAGAYMTAITSSSRTAWTMERPTPLDALLDAMRGQAIDAVIVEGFKTAPYPKIVLLRDSSDVELLHLPNVLAFAIRQQNETLVSVAAASSLPLFHVGELQLDELLRYVEALVAAAAQNNKSNR